MGSKSKQLRKVVELNRTVPNQLSREDRAELRAAHADVSALEAQISEHQTVLNTVRSHEQLLNQAKRNHARAVEALQQLKGQIENRYKLRNGDALNLTTGEIGRSVTPEPAQPPPPAAEAPKAAEA